MIGTTLKDRYTIIASLGVGGMGEVYLATDGQRNQQQVSIKVLEPHLARNREFLTRFRQEAALLRRLDHPNIVHYYEDFTLGEQYYIVMEYVPGGSLLDLIAAQGPLDEAAFRQMALALTDALTRAHDMRVIHRDIKPENILLTPDGTPKLSDFGVAGLLENQPAVKSSLYAGGSPYYMSPQLWERPTANQHDDIWSLGVVLFEMLAGHAPFRGPTEASIIHATLTQPTPDLREIRPDLPAGYAAIIERCLEKDSTLRYQTMREVAVDLERGEALEGAARHSGVFPPRRRRWPWVALGLLLLALLGGVGLLASGVLNGPQPTAIVVVAVIEETDTPAPSATPIIITATPPASLMPTLTRTPGPTLTPFLVTATSLPTLTPSDTPTETPTETPSPTETPTQTLTPTLTLTPTSTLTFTPPPSNTPEPSATATYTPSDTPPPSATPPPPPSATNTPRPTLTPTDTPTGTPDVPATEQAEAQATLDQLSTDTAPVTPATPTPLPSPSPVALPQGVPAGLLWLEDFSGPNAAARWELPPGWQVTQDETGNPVLQASAPGSARKLDAAAWGRDFTMQFRFLLEQDGVLLADFFGDQTRCRSVFVLAANGRGALAYNNQLPEDGQCFMGNFELAALEGGFTGFVWHTLRLEARDDILSIFLDNTRLAVVRNPLPSSLGANGLITVPEGVTTPVLFDDFVINTIAPTDDRDVQWQAGEIYCVQDFATEQTGLALQARIGGDQIEQVWALGPTNVQAQSYLLGAGAATTDENGLPAQRYWFYLPQSDSGLPLPGTYTFIPLRGGVEVTGRRFFVPNRGEYPLTAAPRRLQTVFTAQGVQIFWQPVPPVEDAFNPGGSYLVRIYPEGSDESVRLFTPLYEDRGASSVPRYFLPWGLLNRPPTASGPLLQDLPDGNYWLEVWAVSSRPASGDECRASNSSERLHLNITGRLLTITHADGTIISSLMGEG